MGKRVLLQLRREVLLKNKAVIFHNSSVWVENGGLQMQEKEV